ncbi:Hypothetical predicted protein [Mytilus galloprovincialis]|uniref:Uncharacterized protein n=1 Tax=Mytilus galloprovincialis TaxID=29158 RepID=A0A8B6GDQ9_MYTGA|nr:Hypothetical predicted protein [Mytilus galloprovincialis]
MFLFIVFNLKSRFDTGPVVVGVRPNLPVEGVTLLLGNDLARNKVVVEPIVTSEPVVDVKSPEDDAELYPACVVTRAMARKQQNENLQEDKFDYMDLSDTFIADIEDPGNSEKVIIKPPSVNKKVIMPWPDVNSHSLDRNNLLEEQHKDPEDNLTTFAGVPLAAPLPAGAPGKIDHFKNDEIITIHFKHYLK